jgi:outer membrane cobalamin receptor
MLHRSSFRIALQKAAFCFITLLLFVSNVSVSHAQDAENLTMQELDNLSFDQLLDLDLLQVASRKPLSKKEIPGTVTLIKRDEIVRSGARDLIDALRLVPGFEFGQDVNGAVGMGTRGLWGFEGKILFLVDGLQMNEILYANTPLGNNFPLDIIERIEIIRGPGSSFYGGYAELAVVNIITRKGDDMRAIMASGYFGQMQGGFGRANGTLAFGKKFGEVSVSASAFIGQANRSDRTLLAADSSQLPMLGNQTLQPLNFNLGVQWQGLKARAFYDRYYSSTWVAYGTTVTDKPIANNFTALGADLQYDIKLTEKFTLTPRISYLRQTPWQANDPSTLDTNSTAFGSFFDKTATRTLGSLTLAGDILPNLFATVGVEAFFDNAVASDRSSLSALFNRTFDANGNIISASNTVSYNNIGGYVQGLWTNDFVNVNAGIRVDKYSAVPIAAVPWIGLTKIIGDFNAKLLFGQNFRAPTIENIRINSNVRPEITTALELQLGYQISYNMLLSANLFTVSITNPIVFTTINEQESYFNYPRTGSNGFELEYSVKDFWGFLNLNYSFYVASDNQVPEYTVTGMNNVLLGFAQHKITLNSSFRLFDDNISISPSATFLSERFGYAGTDASGNTTFQRFAPVLLVNAFLQWRNIASIQGLDVGIGAYDILGANYTFIQPYTAGNQPLPGPSREFVFRASYTLAWN